MKKRVLSMLIALAMTLTLMTPSAMALGEEPGSSPNEVLGEAATQEVVEFFDDADLPDNELLFDAYVAYMVFGDEIKVGMYDNWGKDSLTDNTEKELYEQLNSQISAVAAGTATSTKFTLRELSWTSVDAFKASLKKVLNCIITDHPENLYWWGRIQSYSQSTTPTSVTLTVDKMFANTSGESEEIAVNVQQPDGSVKSETRIVYYSTDSTKVQTASAAIAKADAIISRHANEDDYTKLKSYKEEICELVTYNNDALNAGSSSEYEFGENAWQIIYVFDGIDTTNVVCEGYAKAFQYLCNRSTFTNPKIACYTVTGQMAGGTGAGGHMWNVVTMDDGKNYLVDVTNCDLSGSLDDGRRYDSFLPKGTTTLFLVGATSGNVNSGYTVHQPKVDLPDSGGYYLTEHDITFAYDADTLATYPTSVLTLESTDYEYTPPAPELEGTVSISGNEVFGSVLTATANVTNSDFNADTDSLTYQWKRGNDTISGATEATYTVTKDDIGKALTVEVTSEKYSGKLVTASAVTPVEATVKVDVTVNPSDIICGGTATATAKITATNGDKNDTVLTDVGTVTFSSDNTAVATVNTSTGAITGGQTAGSATITATFTADGYTTATGTAKVTVSDITVKSVTVKTQPTTVTYEYGDTFDGTGLVLTVTYSDNSTKDIAYADGNMTFNPTSLTMGTTSVTGTYMEKTFTINITVNAKALTADMVTVADGSVFTGNAVEPAVTVKVGDTTLVKGTDYTVKYESNVNAGNTAKVTVTGTGNYQGEVEKTFSIAKGTPSGTVKVADDAATIYEGATAAAVAEKLTWTGTPAATEGTLTLTSPEKLVAGANTCTWKFSPTDTDNWNEQTGEITITASARSVSKIEVTTDPTNKEYTYGTPFNPAGMVVTVTYDNGDEETISTFPDDRISYNDDLGDASEDTKSVTLTWVADNTKTCTVDGIKVTPKVLNVSGISWDTTSSPFTYDGNEKGVTLTGEIPAELTVTKTGDKATNAGPYTASATFAVKEGLTASNYTISGTNPVTAEWTISKATPDGSGVTLTVNYADDGVKTVPVSDFTAVDGTLAFTPADDDVFETDYPKLAADNKSIDIKLAADLAAEKAGNITIPVTFTPTDSENYNSANWNLVIKITTKKIPTVSVTDYTTTYSKVAVTDADLAPTATGEDGAELTGTWTFVGAAPINAGTYTCKLTFTPTGEAADTYEAVETKAFTVTINKADVTVTAITDTITVGGLAPSPLYNVTGVITGDTLAPAPTVTHTIDTSTVGVYPITVSGPAVSNDGNYSITYVPGQLTVAAATVAVTGVTLSPTTLALTVGGTGTLTVTVAPANATNQTVTWTSSDPSVATVSGGVVTAVGAGTATITVTTEDGGFTDTCTVTVSADGTPDYPVTPVSPIVPDFSGTPGNPSNSNNNTETNTPSNPPAVTGSPIVTPSATVNNGTAEAVVSGEMADQLVEQAASGRDTVVIAPVVPGSVTQTDVVIPASAVSGIAGSSSADLVVETPAANITLPNSSLEDLNRQGGSVVVSTAAVSGGVSIEITAGGQRVDNTAIKAEIPVDCGPGTVAVVVSGGSSTTVRKSFADGSGQYMNVPLDGSATVIFVDNSKTFSDVPGTSWAADAVAFASAHELMNGVTATSFSPDTSMTRGMLAVVLHNLEGNPSAVYTGTFTDVGSGDWYAQAVQWAADSGIIGGVGNGAFAPNASITREQLVVMLYRYAGMPASNGSLSGFSDSARVSNWAQQAMAWAVSNGIVKGSNGALNPQGSATRAEVAQMLMNFVTSGVL